jgi:hypothetical protein
MRAYYCSKGLSLSLPPHLVNPSRTILVGADLVEEGVRQFLVWISAHVHNGSGLSAGSMCMLSLNQYMMVCCRVPISPSDPQIGGAGGSSTP